MKNQEDQQIDVASEVGIQTNMLQQPRDELLEETVESGMKKRSICYVANILTGGILTTALIDTGAEVTRISEDFVSKNRERLQECQTLPINGVTLVGPLGGEAIKTSKQIYVDFQLTNHIIQIVFLVVPKLSRPRIIGIDLLDKFRNHIDLDSKTISFPHLEGKPSIKIRNKENTLSPRRETHKINSIQRIEEDVEILREEIKLKLEETNITYPETE